MAAVGLIESLMTLNLVDELTDSRGSGNRKCLAQGSANILSGLFGGMGGCAMIGQSIINVIPVVEEDFLGVVASIALLCFILFGAPLIEQIPVAALVGVMFMVVIGTFAWSSFRIMKKIPISDACCFNSCFFSYSLARLGHCSISWCYYFGTCFCMENALMIRARKK